MKAILAAAVFLLLGASNLVPGSAHPHTPVSPPADAGSPPGDAPPPKLSKDGFRFIKEPSPSPPEPAKNLDLGVDDLTLGDDPDPVVEGGEPAKNFFGLGGLNLGGAWGNDGHSDGKSWEGDGFAVDTLRKFADEGHDVKGTCAKMYPKPKPPECNCHFFQDGGLISSLIDWNLLETNGADQCPAGTRGWKFDVCLKTSDDIEGTRGKVTMYSPSSCTDTQDKIVCMIEKFRFAPTYTNADVPDDFIGYRATGRVYYDSNDGKGVQTHGCDIFFGRGLPFAFFIEGDPFEDLQQSWLYPGVTYPGTYRSFSANNSNGGPLLTSGSGDVLQDMVQCGLYTP